MRNIISSVLLFSAGATTMFVGTGYEPARRVFRNYRIETPPVEERIIDLPEDGNGWHTSLFVNAKAELRDKELQAWFGSDSRLAALKAQTHWHVNTSDSRMYAARWQTHLPKLPAVVIQQADGKIVYKAGVDRLPRTSRKLADEIAYQIAACPNCPRPRPRPVPVKPVPVKPALPDTPLIGPSNDGAIDEDGGLLQSIPWGLILSMFGLGGGGTLLTALKNNTRL